MIDLPLTTALVWRPTVPAGGLAAVAIVAVVVAVIAMARSPRPSRGTAMTLWAGRIIVLTGLLLIALGPMRQESRPDDRRLASPIAVLVDTSQSMSLAAGPGTPESRYDLVRRHWLDPAFTAAVGENRTIAWRRFARYVRSTRRADLEEATPTGERTELFDAVRRAIDDSLFDRAGGTLVLLSDGHDNDPATVEAAVLHELGQLARARQVRVVAAAVGEPGGAADLALQAHASADAVFEGDPLTITAEIVPRNVAAQDVTVDLRLGGERIARRRVRVNGSTPERLMFELTPIAGDAVAGLLDYEVEVSAAEGEADLSNNARHVFCRLIDRPIRALLLEGRPHWSSRSIARALQGDPRIDLTSVVAYSERRFGVVRYVADGSQRHADDEIALPLDAADLAAFDLVILGRGMELLLPEESAGALHHYVDRLGGGLILARGRAFEPGGIEHAIVEPLSPVQWGERLAGDLRLAFTDAAGDAGLIHREAVGDDVDLAELPAMLAATRASGTRAATVVLATQTPATADAAEAMAAMAYHRVGEGRVLAILTEGLWQWAMLPDRLATRQVVYRSLITGAVRWIALGGDMFAGQRLSVEVDRTSTIVGEPVTVYVRSRFGAARQAVEEADARLEVAEPDGEMSAVQLAASVADPTRLEGGVQVDKPGVYTVRLVGGPEGELEQAARFAAYERSVELRAAEPRPATLQRLAEATGGRTFKLDAVNEAVEYLDQVGAAELAVGQRRDLVTAWATPLVFAGLIGLLTVEWFVRRRHGMW